MNEQELKELEKKIRSEMGRKGYSASLAKLTYEQRKENGRKGGLTRAENLKKGIADQNC
jgi:hypothetical protein